MIESFRQPEPPEASESPIEFSDNTFIVDAALIGQLLDIPAARVPILMRQGTIASACQRAAGDQEGEFHLTFFYHNRRARLSTDPAGHILGRSVVDLNDPPIPDAANRPNAQHRLRSAGG